MKEGTFYTVFKVTTLKLKDQHVVVGLFDQICRQIQPILEKRKWKVGELAEFYPSDPCLLGLNINRGTKIQVRCRKPNDKNSFYVFEDIMGTTLHELAHIKVGNHGPEFQKLLDTLWEEVDTFAKPNSYNPNFSGCGFKLSSDKHNPTSKLDVKKLAAKAAEKRMQNARLMGPPQICGGRKHNTASDPKLLAAEAAMKRFKINNK